MSIQFSIKYVGSYFQVHWFPRHISELDLIANRTLDAGTDLQSDHPGFNDVEYRNRRALLAEQAMKYRMGMELPSTEYSDDEVKTWGVVWDKMEGLLEKVRCNTCVCAENAVLTFKRKTHSFIQCLLGFLGSSLVCMQRIQGELK
jgi:hypothetical protein